MKRFCLNLVLLCIIGFINSAFAETRIKDIANFVGVRGNPLVGKGLVVGLNGTGDNLRNAVFTKKELVDLLEKFKTNIQGENLKTSNVAAVTVTGVLTPFARNGSKIRVDVSTIGDSTSLKGGVLLPTYLLGPDGMTYAVAHGPVMISSFIPVSDDVKTAAKTSETSGFIEGGAIVENEVPFEFTSLDEITIALHHSDFSTATQIAESINNYVDGNTAAAIDPGTVRVKIPSYRKDDTVQFMSEIEQIRITPDYKAKVVINESTGTIVMGNNVKIRPVAVAQGNLVVNVSPQIKQRDNILPLMNRQKQVELTRGIDQKRGMGVAEVDGNTNLSELVEGLNKLGVGPRDLMAILYTIKRAGALDAEIEVAN